MMVAQSCEYTKNKNWIEHFKWVNGVVCGLNLEKEGFTKIKF